jgi:hypothetical protein
MTTRCDDTPCPRLDSHLQVYADWHFIHSRANQKYPSNQSIEMRILNRCGSLLADTA